MARELFYNPPPSLSPVRGQSRRFWHVRGTSAYPTEERTSQIGSFVRGMLAASPASITIAATLFPTVMLSMETSLKLSLCWTQPSLVVKTLGVGS